MRWDPRLSRPPRCDLSNTSQSNASTSHLNSHTTEGRGTRLSPEDCFKILGSILSEVMLVSGSLRIFSFKGGLGCVYSAKPQVVAQDLCLTSLCLFTKTESLSFLTLT